MTSSIAHTRIMECKHWNKSSFQLYSSLPKSPQKNIEHRVSMRRISEYMFKQWKLRNPDQKWLSFPCLFVELSTPLMGGVSWGCALLHVTWWRFSFFHYHRTVGHCHNHRIVCCHCCKIALSACVVHSPIRFVRRLIRFVPFLIVFMLTRPKFIF